MDFNNLRRNILALIGEKWHQSGKKGEFSLGPVRSEFSDIPESDLEEHIESLNRQGYIKLSDSGNRASLTRKGLERLKIIDDDAHNGRMVVPGRLK